MAAFLDACRFSSSATGTADWLVAGPVGGYMTPAAAGAVNGRTYKYRAESADLSQWELGEGVWNTSTGVLSRATVLFNSLGTTSKINFTASPQVAVVALKEDLISIEETNSFTVSQQGQARQNIGASSFCGAGKLSYVSATQLKFAPFNGDVIRINGVVYQIPAAGVTISNAGLGASQLWYIYAYLNAGVVALTASQTGHATSVTAGNVGTEIISGNDQYTLVGMAYINASSQFTPPWVRSWLNDSGITNYTFGTTLVNLSSNTIAEVDSGMRNQLLLWAGENVSVNGMVSFYNNTVGALTYAVIGWNAVTPSGSYAYNNQAIANYVANLNMGYATSVGSDGLYYATIGTLVGSGTATFSYRDLRVASIRR